MLNTRMLIPASTLHIECWNLILANSIRVSILNKSEKRIKRKKTSSKKNTHCPQFNEALTFNVPKTSLCDTVLEIEVHYLPGYI